MKMLPAELGRESVTSSERRVFQALGRSQLAGTALHSLNLPEHQYKLTGELDFAVVLSELVLVIEVKGGQVSRQGGVWTYSDRAGHHRTSREGPFLQVESGMYALRERLKQRLPVNGEDLAFGFLVVTTDVDIPSSTAEWAEETYCGRGAFTRDFDTALTRAATYWKSRQRGKLRISKDVHVKLIHELRPDFDRSPLLDARADLLELAYVRLTDEQFDRLDAFSDAPRVVCAGGAGTGKTFLAMEFARRQRALGRSVIYICRSEVLAVYVKRVLKGAGVEVRGSSDLPANVRFDVLVVDEAQDLMNLESVDRLERVVHGGWMDGRWILFMDPNRQAHLYVDYDPDVLDYVRSFSPALARLKHNCRNTQNIAFNTRAITGADMGVASAGAGPHVQTVTVADDAEETARLQDHLRLLREHEVRPEQITIVSLRGDWETSAARNLRQVRKGQLSRLDSTNAAEFPGDSITWASAVDIKGLENRFVCVIDIDAAETDEDIDLLYVALSRARAGLWMATQPKIGIRIAELFKEHAPAAMEALKGAAR
jgi:hypothetical protein